VTTPWNFFFVKKWMFIIHSRQKTKNSDANAQQTWTNEWTGNGGLRLVDQCSIRWLQCFVDELVKSIAVVSSYLASHHATKQKRIANGKQPVD
jgi:hypothetical protein